MSPGTIEDEEENEEILIRFLLDLDSRDRLIFIGK